MPRYLLRRWVVRRIVRRLRPKDFIEIGSGSGEMAEWLAGQGISGVAVEISPGALALLRKRFDDNPDVDVFSEDARSLDREADLLLTMEVIEHIEDDVATLREWHDLIRPGGHIILSTPALQRYFSEDDVMAGHFRRYERAELIEKLESAGFERPEVLSYGFPISWILKRIRNHLAKKKLESDQRSMQERTAASGVERDFPWLRFILNDFCFLPFLLFQMPFLHRDWTDGYLAIARKPAARNGK